ncbi:MAG: spore germination protein GerW family protein [Methanocellales archaeon]
MAIEDLIRLSVEKLSEMVTSETVVGKEIKVGDKSIIPLVKVCFGFGGGGGEGEAPEKTAIKKGFGGGSGAGATIEPVALLLIDGEKIGLLRVGAIPGTLEKLIEMVPMVIEKIRVPREEKEK